MNTSLKKIEDRNWSVKDFPFTGKPFWIVLTGAGISVESGLKTFRDQNGLWEGHDVQEVASPEGFRKNPELVQKFYNDRRKQLGEVEPNPAHRLIAEMEKNFDVLVVTQNVDDLHERGGSSQVLHLHGELRKVRSSKYRELIYDQGFSALNTGDLCENGSQLRPHIVWFGENVPLYGVAAEFAKRANGILVVGTSLQVYPAAGLIHEVKPGTRKVLIDKYLPAGVPEDFTAFETTASEGMHTFLALISDS